MKNLLENAQYLNSENSALIHDDGMFGGSGAPDLLLTQKAEQQCRIEGINYKGLAPIQRLFLTKYRCSVCSRLLPLYCLSVTNSKRIRCGRCGHLISFTNSGKYGRLRKRIVFALKSKV